MKRSWPKCFVTGKIKYPNTYRGKRQAIEDGLKGWKIANTKFEIPVNFGKGMAEIAMFLNSNGTQEDLIRCAKKKFIWFRFKILLLNSLNIKH